MVRHCHRYTTTNTSIRKYHIFRSVITNNEILQCLSYINNYTYTIVVQCRIMPYMYMFVCGSISIFSVFSFIAMPSFFMELLLKIEILHILHKYNLSSFGVKPFFDKSEIHSLRYWTWTLLKSEILPFENLYNWSTYIRSFPPFFRTVLCCTVLSTQLGQFFFLYYSVMSRLYSTRNVITSSMHIMFLSYQG